MSLFGIASQESGHQVSDSAERPRRINASFWATTNLNGLQVCLGGCRPWTHQSPPSQEQLTSGQQWPSLILRLKSREDVLLFSSPGDPLLQVWTASEFWVLRSVTELMALVKTQVSAFDFKMDQRW